MSFWDSTSLHDWEVIAAIGFWAVFVGVAGEGLEIVAKLYFREWFKKYEFKLDIIAGVCWIVLCIGVAVENIGDTHVWVTADRQNEDSRQKVKEAEAEAQTARKETAIAQEQAGEANELAAKANERAAELEKGAEDLAKQVAEANARAAASESDAANARLEAARIWSTLGWRNVDSDLTHKLIADLSKVPGRVYIRSMASDPEAEHLAAQFKMIFEASKWDVYFSSDRYPPTATFLGIIIPDSKDVADTQSIRDIFGKYGVNEGDTWQTDDRAYFSSGRIAPQSMSVATIIVGSRPGQW